MSYGFGGGQPQWQQQGQWAQPWQQPGQQSQPWQQPNNQFPGPKSSRGIGPIILVSLGILALIMAGLVVYALVREPDYQNEDYVPPPPGNVLPGPRISTRDAPATLTDNALYAQQMPVPVRCELPEMDLATATDAEVTAYLDELMACNMRVWDLPFRATGTYDLVRPKVNVYHERVSHPCGGGKESGPNGLYCGANQEVYFSRLLPKAHPAFAVVEKPHVIDEFMSHEFAHGIQFRIGILQSSQYLGRQVSREEALEYSRRTELQADCLSGMFIQAVTDSAGYTQEDSDNILESVRSAGDDAIRNNPNIVGDHGRSQSRVYWHQIGRTGTDIGRCNTFTAPKDYVN